MKGQAVPTPHLPPWPHDLRGNPSPPGPPEPPWCSTQGLILGRGAPCWHLVPNDSGTCRVCCTRTRAPSSLYGGSCFLTRKCRIRPAADPTSWSLENVWLMSRVNCTSRVVK